MSIYKKTNAHPAPFTYADGLILSAVEKSNAAYLANSLRGRCSDGSLVKASKSPTAITGPKKTEKSRRLLTPSATSIKPYRHVPETPPNTPGVKAIVEFREWSEEWRLRTSVETSLSPPPISGPRVSWLLSQRAARKIAESCDYVARTKGGYATFVTGTFTPESRQRIAQGETTIQREVSRSMDALQKIYQRGCTFADGGQLSPHDDTLDYCWVVEIPKNENGEDNPHVHILMRWKVPYANFASWCKRLESVWGNGYFHVEKIRDTACAGAYMAKAAGYLTKGANENQGQVKGNRYGISASARAPGWHVVSEHDLGRLGAMIADVYDHMTRRYGEKFQQRKKLKSALSTIPKDKVGLRRRIGERLTAVRAELNALPIRCNRYQIVFKKEAALNSFFAWAESSEQGDTSLIDWLPLKELNFTWAKQPKPPSRFLASYRQQQKPH